MIAYAVRNSASPRDPKPSRHSDYLRFIRRQPCVVCARTWGIESAHTGQRGLGQKADDRFALPLCRHHHRTGQDSHHRLGKRFWGFHGLNRVELIQQLQKLYTDECLNGGGLQGHPREVSVPWADAGGIATRRWKFPVSVDGKAREARSWLSNPVHDVDRFPKPVRGPPTRNPASHLPSNLKNPSTPVLESHLFTIDSP